MSFDVRTRVDGEVERLEPAAARDAIAAALESAADLLRPALHYAKHPLTVDVDGDTWHVASDGRSVALFDGAASEGLRLRLTADQLADLWCDQATPMTWFSSGALELDGRLEHLLDWWVLLRGAIDQRAPHVAGDIDLSGTDLAQSFTLDDRDDDIRAFLAAGRLRPHPRRLRRGRDGRGEQGHGCRRAHLREGRRPFVVGTDERRRRPSRAHAGRGRRVPVDRPARGGRAPRAHRGDSPRAAIEWGTRTGNRIEALFKPIGVVEGISDVPWHKDCSLGRHSYECCSLTVGISVTGAGRDVGPAAGRGRLAPSPRLAGLRAPATTTCRSSTCRRRPVTSPIHLSCTTAHGPATGGA